MPRVCSRPPGPVPIPPGWASFPSSPLEGRPMAKAKKKAKSLYSPHPALAMEASYAEKLKERTGKTLDEWIAFTREAGPETEKERREWLKEQHGLTTNYAWWVAERSVNKGWFDPEPE